MEVVVASSNPVKIAAARIAFERVFRGEAIITTGHTVPSGVADQPFSDEETYRGAYNRAVRARALHPNAHFWVGIEGGVEPRNNELAAFAWVVVTDGRRFGKARTATFFLPPEVARLVRSGKELGEADDIVFGRSESKRKEGAVGLLTHGLIDRSRLYTEAVTLALIPFVQPALYPLSE